MVTLHNLSGEAAEAHLPGLGCRLMPLLCGEGADSTGMMEAGERR